MADGFIVRKGGVTTEQATMPTILNISEDGNKINFKIKNNDTETAVILFEVDDTTPDANSLELAAGATSDTITITGLDESETYIVFATANVTGKVKSEVASQSITTSPVIYTAATGGTTLEYDSGGKRYKSHTFTSNGTFEVTTAGNGNRNEVDYLIIAGGGGGGLGSTVSRGSGGGGAGGFRTTFGTQGGLGTLNDIVTVTEASFDVTIGSGGGESTNGSNSIVAFSTSVTSIGGGRGGLADINNGSPGLGGSGGGGAGSVNITGGAGTANQGFAGGNAPATGGGGGGGGAISVGATTTNLDGGDGGNGLSNLLRTGSNETRAGGGGGAINDGRTDRSPVGGSGGNGGGGNGAQSDVAATTGTINTGSGGGGGAGRAQRTGASGGSGIVVIRYEIAPSV